MAGRQLDAIAARLIAAGRGPEEPVALIQDATRPTQSVRHTTLGEAAAVPASKAPTLIVIGPVVALAASLAAWQQTTPMIVIHDQQPSRAARGWQPSRATRG